MNFYIFRRTAIRKTVSLLLLSSFLFTNVAAAEILTGDERQISSDTRNNVSFTTDLTQLGREGRLHETPNFKSETEALIKVLERGSRQPLLVDEANESPEFVVEQLAIKIARGDVPESLRNTNIVKIEFADIYSNSTTLVEADETVRQIVAKLAEEGSFIARVKKRE